MWPRKKDGLTQYVIDEGFRYKAKNLMGRVVCVFRGHDRLVKMDGTVLCHRHDGSGL